MTNGWMICTATADQGQLGGTPRGRPILIEKVRGRDNIAHLLAQVAVLLGDDGE